jgi:hypothetical protein
MEVESNAEALGILALVRNNTNLKDYVRLPTLKWRLARPLILRGEFPGSRSGGFTRPGMFVDVVLAKGKVLESRVKIWCEGWECLNKDVISFPES